MARSNILMAARAAGIHAIDTVFLDLKNMEGFINETKMIKQLGFDGKSVIHPKQIQEVHKIYTPSKKDIEHAIRVIEGIKEEKAQGSGVIQVDGKMVDAAIVDRAIRVLKMAKVISIPDLTEI